MRWDARRDGIPRSRIRPTRAPFHGVIPGKQSVPLGQIDLPVTFGDKANFRTETLTFEVADFASSYHAIFGRPCYAKFMAIPCYTYLKLKMPGPRGVITVSTEFKQALGSPRLTPPTPTRPRPRAPSSLRKTRRKSASTRRIRPRPSESALR